MPKPPPWGRAPATRRPQSEGRGSVLVSPLADSPGFLVRMAQLRAFDEFHRNFAGLNVTPAGYAVLALIAANPGVRPGTIAEELHVKPSNVAVLVNNLVAAGLIRRTVDAAELRASQLHTTAAGADAWVELEKTHQTTDARLVQALTPAESSQFVTLLQKLLHR